MRLVKYITILITILGLNVVFKDLQLYSKPPNIVEDDDLDHLAIGFNA